MKIKGCAHCSILLIMHNFKRYRSQYFDISLKLLGQIISSLLLGRD